MTVLPFRLITRLPLLACGVFAVVCCAGDAFAQSVRSEAVVNLTFDEVSGDAYDSAVGGGEKDHGGLRNGARRVESPFWNQRGKQALWLSAPGKQFVQISDSPDVDHQTGVSFSFFYLNLHDPSDNATHGIVAKRQNGDGEVTNYGINYNPKQNNFQVYLNPGGGFRVAGYDSGEVIGSRRRVFLTATFEVGDAPQPDLDGDRDDIRVRLFVNGRQVTPANVNQGHAVGGDAWLIDVDSSAILNDVPVTLGASHAEAEHTNAVIDEFSLFGRALTPVEAAMLFVEVAGPDSVQQAERETQVRTPPPVPNIAVSSLHGLRIGHTTRLTIRGRDLTCQPRVELPIEGFEQTVVDGSNGGQLIVDLTLPPDAAPGFYPVRVRTAGGISNALALAVDTLAQHPAKDTSPEIPALLPAAFSGMLSGSAQPRVYFAGTLGQRVVVEVESRRLGSTVDPVLEIKTLEGTPLLVEWGKIYLRGDARAELQLPHDGLYFAELHDLEYKSPGQSPFRIRIGDLTTADLYFPPAVGGEGALLKPLGIGFPPAASIRAHPDTDPAEAATLLTLPPELGLAGPAPILRLSDGVEVVEQTTQTGEPQLIDAQFAERKHVPIMVNGRIETPGEEDRYLLQVAAGQKLNFSVAARSVDSPLDGQLLIRKHPEGDVLASSDDRAGTLDPGLEYTVPEGVEQVVAAVRDLNESGGPHFLYRLKIVPSGQPDFSLMATASRINLPQRGSIAVRLKVNRSAYTGPIRLSVLGDETVSIVPHELPAGGGNRELFVTLTHNGNDADRPRRLRILGESTGLDPAIRRTVEVPSIGKDVTPPGHRHQLAAALGSPSWLSIDLEQLPTTLLKGLDTQIAVAVRRDKQDISQAVRLTLMSTEASRPVDPRDRGKGNKPLIRSKPEQFVNEWSDATDLKLAVPLDVAQGDVDFVVRADVVPHAYSTTSVASVYSAPFRISVQDAVGLTLEEGTFQLAAGKVNTVKGKLTRTAPFGGRVALSIKGLPDGFFAPGIVVEGDKEQFEMKIYAPFEEQARDLPNVTLNVRAAGGGPILSPRGLALKLAPPAKPQEAKEEAATAE